MSRFPVLPLYTDAFIADTTHLTAEETGAYLMLLMVAWRMPNCALPDDDMSLARWARVSIKTWTRIKPRVMAFWAQSEVGEWCQSRLSQEQLRASQRASVARENGSRGGRPKSLESQGIENPAGLQKETQKKASISISNNNPVVPKPNSDIDTLFGEFKSAYPKRDGSQDWAKSRTRFASLVGKGIDPSRLIAAASSYRHEAERKGNVGTSYVKQAATFLSGTWQEYGAVTPDAPAAASSTSPAKPHGWPDSLPHPDRVQAAWSMGQWPGSWGPRPGEPGCRITLDQMTRMVASSPMGQMAISEPAETRL